MKILIDINHPAHVHLFKHFAREMQKKGHTLLFTARAKEFAIPLLEAYGFPFVSFGPHYKGLQAKLLGLLKFDALMLRTAREFKPDLFLSLGSIYAAHAAFILRKPHLALDDTENARSHHLLYKPFSTHLLNPTCFKLDFGKKQLRYPGYHELAYLHPHWFQADRRILEELGVGEAEPFAIVRFVSWNASHDVGHKGISLENKIKAVKRFSQLARVFITSEKELPAELQPFQIKIPPHRIHHALYYCRLLFGESATMASECAVLGTPSIYLDNEGRGYTDEEEHEYGLVYNFSEGIADQERAIAKGIEILQQPVGKEIYQSRRRRLLAEKIDVTSFLVWLVENYPQSIDTLHGAPTIFDRFRWHVDKDE